MEKTQVEREQDKYNKALMKDVEEEALGEIYTQHAQSVEQHQDALKNEIDGPELLPEICKIYSKKHCKECYGRGFLVYDRPAGFLRPYKQWGDYCSCVKRNLKKMLK